MLTSVTVVAALCGVVVGWGIRTLTYQRRMQHRASQASTADRTPQELIQALESGDTGLELYRECLRVLKQADIRTHRWVDPEQEWRA